MPTTTRSIRQIIAVSIACSMLAAPRLIRAEEDWSPVYTGKPVHTGDRVHSGEQASSLRSSTRPAQDADAASSDSSARRRPAVQQVSYQVLPSRPSPAQRLWAPSRAEQRAAVGPRGNGCIYNLFDGLAGGIEHVLGLNDRPGGGSAHCDSGACDSAFCDDPGCDANRAFWPTAQPRTPLRRLPRSAPGLSDPSAAPPRGAEPTLPAPQVPDQLVDPFEDDQAWTPGRDASIHRSAYFDSGSSTSPSEPAESSAAE